MSEERKILEAKMAQLKARLQQIQQRESAQARRDETRRLIVLGGAVSAALANGERVEILNVSEWLAARLKRPQDRNAWGL